MKSKKPVIVWLYIGAIMVATMVVVGGITRLTNSGLSMVDWNLIMGAVPPASDQEWQIEFEKYQQYPEFQEINSDFGLQDFKSIYWWEYSHRLLGRVIGIVFLLPFLYFLLFKYLDRKLTIRLSVLFLLGGLQGFLGWYMVKSGLVDRPDVSHFRLAIHLVAALILLSYIIWLIMSLTNTKLHIVRVQLYYKTMWFLYFAIFAQITFGAFVAGLNAGKFHNSFPLMDGKWVPDILKTYWAEYGWVSLIDTVSGVQYVHRWLGVLLMLFVIGLYMNYRPSLLPHAQKRLFTLLIVLLTQGVIGILTLLMAAPFFFAIIHQFMAVVLVTVTVINLYGAKPGFPSRA